MQPNGQAPAPAPQQNPYDYLLNPPTAPRKQRPLFSGGNKVVKVVFVAVVLVVVLIAYSVFSNLTKTNYDAVVRLAERQQEIVRVSNLGLASAQDPATRVYVSTIASTTQSEQYATVAFLSKKQIKVSPSVLALKQDSSIDTSLKSAQQNNTYDKVLTDTLNDLLLSYQKAQKEVTDVGKSKSETALFATLFLNAKVLDGIK